VNPHGLLLNRAFYDGMKETLIVLAATMAVAMFVTGMHMSFSTSSAASPEPSVPPEIEEARQMVAEAENELRAASEAEKLFFEVQVEQAHAHLGMLLEEHERSDHN